MDLSQRKIELISWISSLSSEKSLKLIEKMRGKIEDNEVVPEEIMDLLNLSCNVADDELIRHTNSKDILSRYGKKSN